MPRHPSAAQCVHSPQSKADAAHAPPAAAGASRPVTGRPQTADTAWQPFAGTPAAKAAAANTLIAAHNEYQGYASGTTGVQPINRNLIPITFATSPKVGPWGPCPPPPGGAVGLPTLPLSPSLTLRCPAHLPTAVALQRQWHDRGSQRRQRRRADSQRAAVHGRRQQMNETISSTGNGSRSRAVKGTRSGAAAMTAAAAR